MSKINPQFFGTIKGGKLSLENPDRFSEYLASLEDKEVCLWVRKAEYARSIPQNKYYWGVIVRMVADEMGIIPDEAHEFLKGLFLKVGVEANGRRWEVTKSTADLSIADFVDYTEKCRMWAAQMDTLNINIPLPNEMIFEDL